VKTLFVTGTDTAVGKTVVSRALLQCCAQAGFSAVGYKPVARDAQPGAEGPRSKDALLLQQSSTLSLAYPAVNPVALLDGEMDRAPPLDYALLNQGLAALQHRAEWVIVEGTGGWRCLMNDSQPLSSWVKQAQLPVVLVVGIKEGCISHALLTAEAIVSDGLPFAGWVANRINPGLAHYADIIARLTQRLPGPLLGELPYLPRAEQRDLTHYIDLSRLGDAPSSGMPSAPAA